MDKITAYILPSIVVFILLFGVCKGIKVFDCFLEGAKEGLKSVAGLLPPLIGLVTAVAMLRASGALDVLVWVMSPVARFLGIPQEVMPLTVLSPISGSGSLTMFESIMNNCGPDSTAGRVASVIMGSTETTFYAVTVYFGAIGVKRTKHTIPAAVLADLTSYVCSAWAVRLFWG